MQLELSDICSTLEKTNRITVEKIPKGYEIYIWTVAAESIRLILNKTEFNELLNSMEAVV